MKYKLLLIVLIGLVSIAPICSALESSVPLEFVEEYPLLVDDVNLETTIDLDFINKLWPFADTQATVGFNGSLDASLEFSLR